MLRFLIQKEFLQIRRNSFLPKLIVIFPIVIMCVMPWVMQMEVKNIRVDVVDNDRSTHSQRLVHAIEASNYFIFNGQKPSYQAALSEIEHGKADVVLVIQRGYGKTKEMAASGVALPSDGVGAKLLIAANAVNGTKGSMGSAYLTQIVNSSLFTLPSSLPSSSSANVVPVDNSSLFPLPSSLPSSSSANVAPVGNSSLFTLPSSSSANVAPVGNSSLFTLPSSSSANVAPVGNSSLFTLHSSLLYNKHQSYKLYMIPALLAIVMMLMTGFLPTLNIVGEKEAGTIEQINVTPVSKWAFILSKLIPYWLIALFVVTVCLLLAWLVYGLTPSGPLWLVFLLAMLLALFFSSLGLIVSNYSDTMQQAMFVMWFFIVCILLLSGLFTPTRSMPHWAYLTTYVNPMHYFIDAIRTVFIRGGGFSEIAHQVYALLGIGLFMSVWAVQSYKKNS